MHERLSRLLLRPILPATQPDEDFLSAGPVRQTPAPLHAERRSLLLAELRRARGRGVHRQAA